MLWKESILEKRESIFKGLIETDEFLPFEIYAHISINFIQNIFTGLSGKQTFLLTGRFRPAGDATAAGNHSCNEKTLKH